MRPLGPRPAPRDFPRYDAPCMRVIETPRLTLEPLTVSHAEEMFRVLSDPAIYEFENQPPESVAALSLRYQRLESRVSPDGTERWLNWVIRRRGFQLIGYVQATLSSSGRAAIAYELSSEFWRQGFGLEATQAMITELTEAHAVRELTAVLKRENFRSLGLLERLGFVPAQADLLVQCQVDPDEALMQLSCPPLAGGRCLP